MTTTFERLCTLLEEEHRVARNRPTLDAPLQRLGNGSPGTVVRCVDGLVTRHGVAAAAAPGTRSVQAS